MMQRCLVRVSSSFIVLLRRRFSCTVAGQFPNIEPHIDRALLDAAHLFPWECSGHGFHSLRIMINVIRGFDRNNC